MKKNPSWKINEGYKLLHNKFDSIIKTSITYSNTLNENDLVEVEELLEEAYQRGWYPFVSEILKDIEKFHSFDYIYEINKDRILFEFLMLEEEADILEEFGDIDVKEFKERIQKLKGLL